MRASAVCQCVMEQDRSENVFVVDLCDNYGNSGVDITSTSGLFTRSDDIVTDEAKLYSGKGESVCESEGECLASVSNGGEGGGTVACDRQKKLSFLHWNVNGLAGKLGDKDFIEYVSFFDFICLTETFLDHFTSSVFSDHVAYCKPAVKLTRQGRRSGGVVCLVKREFAPHVREIKCNHGNFLCFVLDKNIFGFDRDVVLLCAYIPPENSTYYDLYDNEMEFQYWKIF